MPRPLSEYLRRIHDDTIIHHKPMMRYRVELAGADRVAPGSDHSADTSYLRKVDCVTKFTEFTARERDLILRSNAQRSFRT